MAQFYHYPLLLPLPNETEWKGQIAKASEAFSLPLVSALLPLLDGSHSQEEVIGGLLVAGFEIEQILSAQTWFTRAGLLVESPSSQIGQLTENERAEYKS